MSFGMPKIAFHDLPRDVQQCLRKGQTPNELARLDDFIIWDQIGCGGMGCVFRATSARYPEPIALKLMRPVGASTDVVIERFRREARILERLKHPHIVPIKSIHHFDTGQMMPYLVMPLLTGSTLADRLTLGRLLSLGELLHVAADALEALAYAHRHQVIHRDIKPANLWLESDPQSPIGFRVKVLDFGLARDLHDVKLTITGQAYGTLAYSAPEQLASSKRVDARADLYSLGATLYHAWSGRLPYSPEAVVPHSQPGRFAHESPPSLNSLRPGLPDSVRLWIECLLQTKPDNRYRNADMALMDLRRIIKAVQAKVAPDTVLPGVPSESQAVAGLPTPKRSQRRKFLLCSAVVMTLGLAVGARLQTLGYGQVFGQRNEKATDPTTATLPSYDPALTTPPGVAEPSTVPYSPPPPKQPATITPAPINEWLLPHEELPAGVQLIPLDQLQRLAERANHFKMAGAELNQYQQIIKDCHEDRVAVAWKKVSIPEQEAAARAYAQLAKQILIHQITWRTFLSELRDQRRPTELAKDLLTLANKIHPTDEASSWLGFCDKSSSHASGGRTPRERLKQIFDQHSDLANDQQNGLSDEQMIVMHRSWLPDLDSILSDASLNSELLAYARTKAVHVMLNVFEHWEPSILHQEVLLQTLTRWAEALPRSPEGCLLRAAVLQAKVESGWVPVQEIPSQLEIITAHLEEGLKLQNDRDWWLRRRWVEVQLMVSQRAFQREPQRWKSLSQKNFQALGVWLDLQADVEGQVHEAERRLEVNILRSKLELFGWELDEYRANSLHLVAARANLQNAWIASLQPELKHHQRYVAHLLYHDYLNDASRAVSARRADAPQRVQDLKQFVQELEKSPELRGYWSKGVLDCQALASQLRGAPGDGLTRQDLKDAIEQLKPGCRSAREAEILADWYVQLSQKSSWPGDRLRELRTAYLLTKTYPLMSAPRRANIAAAYGLEQRREGQSTKSTESYGEAREALQCALETYPQSKEAWIWATQLAMAIYATEARELASDFKNDPLKFPGVQVNPNLLRRRTLAILELLRAKTFAELRLARLARPAQLDEQFRNAEKDLKGLQQREATLRLYLQEGMAVLNQPEDASWQALADLVLTQGPVKMADLDKFIKLLPKEQYGAKSRERFLSRLLCDELRPR